MVPVRWLARKWAVCRRPTLPFAERTPDWHDLAMETLKSHEFHPRQDFPVLCAACGQHELAAIHPAPEGSRRRPPAAAQNDRQFCGWDMR